MVELYFPNALKFDSYDLYLMPSPCTISPSLSSLQTDIQRETKKRMHIVIIIYWGMFDLGSTLTMEYPPILEP